MRRVKISCTPLYSRIGILRDRLKELLSFFWFLIIQTCAVTLFMKGEMVVLDLAKIAICLHKNVTDGPKEYHSQQTRQDKLINQFNQINAGRSA